MRRQGLPGGRLSAPTLAVAISLAVLGCGSPAASPSLAPSHWWQIATDSIDAPTSSAASPSASASPTEMPDDLVLDGATSDRAWSFVAWTGTGGLGDVGEIYRWKGGWITQTKASVYKGQATFWVSVDGRNWHRTTSSLREAKLEAVSGEYLLASGRDDLSGRPYWTSNDATDWRSLSAKGIGRTNMSIAGGPAGYVAISAVAGDVAIYSSVDGNVWSSHSMPWLKLPLFVAFAGGRYLLFGFDQASVAAIWWSTDGLSWSRASPPPGGYFGSPTGLAVGHDGLLTATGLSWSASPDGVSWKYPAKQFDPVGPAYAAGDPGFPCADGIVSGNGDQIVAYKWNGSAWASTDGENWRQLAVPRLPDMAAWATASAKCKTPGITLRVLQRGIQLGDHYGAAG